ncbi:MAG: fasciclin domain-containing protein [Bacteroidota bacterium]
MKKNLLKSLMVVALLLPSIYSCNAPNEEKKEDAAKTEATPAGGQASVQDDQSAKDIVKVAVGSKDHTTLVAAIKAAEYVDVLANTGPFTVFAPTNAAFDKLPKGTVEGLLKPEAKKDLRNILEYHVSVGVFKAESFKDGQVIGQANGDNVTIKMVNGKPTVNGANILASIPASNGIIHVVDAVLLPPKKK